ncbi:esterase/lipase family protein [Jeotgalibacillus aurantiacus]|uniref:esterase/lipase family protein n=1 Tax=Jeotgalibacillus aurantiacus TaxID=2763266 RepID=UPI001D09F9AC|nr:alpha/beta fold hydrolase [Jeotgalibacillus aurantiacus]
MRKPLSMFLAFMLLLSMAMPSAAFAGGFKSPGDANLVPGTILMGATPAYVDPNKPVVVFVQGLTNDSTVWYTDNDMYNRAFQAGYQTAFVELYDSGGSPRSYWDNGAMLAGQLQQISNHYGGKKLVIVAYSKGGVDTQVALIHQGKYPLVSNVITLGSPHYGSELADLANSSSFGWLANLIGQNSAGTQSLQTGNMRYFRSITDNRFEVSQNRYLSLAGNRTGPIFSSYWYGSGFIDGPSDGVVSVASSKLPYATSLGVGNWNHGEVNKGSNVFSIFQPYLTQQRAASTFSAFNEVAATAEVTEPSMDVLVRGGQQDGLASESFYVESEAEKLVINWLSATQHDKVELTRPGKAVPETFNVTSVEDDTMFFKGAYHHTITIDQPEAGEWKAATVSDAPTAYALMVTFDSALNDQLVLEPEADKKNWNLKTQNGLAAKSNGKASVKAFADIGFVPGNGKDNKKLGQKMRIFKQSGNAIQLPSEEGSYNMTVEVEGTTPTGEKFQRTVIKSVFVDEKGNAY